MLKMNPSLITVEDRDFHTPLHIVSLHNPSQAMLELLSTSKASMTSGGTFEDTIKYLAGTSSNTPFYDEGKTNATWNKYCKMGLE